MYIKNWTSLDCFLISESWKDQNLIKVNQLPEVKEKILHRLF